MNQVVSEDIYLCFKGHDMHIHNLAWKSSAMSLTWLDNNQIYCKSRFRICNFAHQSYTTDAPKAFEIHAKNFATTILNLDASSSTMLYFLIQEPLIDFLGFWVQKIWPKNNKTINTLASGMFLA